MRNVSALARILILPLMLICFMPGCSDDSDDPSTPGTPPEISFDVAPMADLVEMLAGIPADLTMTVSFTVQDGYQITGVGIYAVGNDNTRLAQMSDDGSSTNHDAVAEDGVYTGFVEGLQVDSPQAYSLRVKVETSRDGDNFSTWSPNYDLSVLATDVYFRSDLLANLQGIPLNQAANIVFSSEVVLAETAEIGEVELFAVDADGDVLESVGYLYDNGNLDNFDEIEGDGVFTGLVAGDPYTAEQTLYFRAQATATEIGGTDEYDAWSSILPMPVLEVATEDDLVEVIADLDELEADYGTYVGGGMTDADAKSQMVADLMAEADIQDAYVSSDGATVWAVYDDGLEVGVYLPTDPDVDVFGGASGQRSIPASSVGSLPDAGWSRPAPTSKVADPDEVQSERAIILSPFHSWINTLAGQTDPCDDVYTLFDESECPTLQTDYFWDGGADVDAFAGLSPYGAICIVTHGTLQKDGQVCIMTGETVNLMTTLEYFWDLYGLTPTMSLLSHGGHKYYSVKARFIDKYNNNMPNSMIYVCACQGMKNNTLQLAFRNSGAGYVCGYDETVSVTYANGVTLDFWSNVLDFGDSAGDAHDNVVPQQDPHIVNANFVQFGNTDLTFSSDLKNGDFEAGVLTGWTPVGDGRVISQLGGTTALEGGFMGIISSGLGFTTDSGQISQTVCLSADAGTIDFNYNFFSEEFLEWCGSEFQDYFEVTAESELFGTEQLFYIAIDDMCDWALVPAGIQFDVGPHEEEPADPVGVYMTGWVATNLDVSHLAGESVTFTFRAGDVGDSIYDSAILLDGIVITDAP